MNPCFTQRRRSWFQGKFGLCHRYVFEGYTYIYSMLNCRFARGWVEISFMFMVHPEFLGKMTDFTGIGSDGWFDYQLDEFWNESRQRSY